LGRATANEDSPALKKGTAMNFLKSSQRQLFKAVVAMKRLPSTSSVVPTVAALSGGGYYERISYPSVTRSFSVAPQPLETAMFCRQCEQTEHGKACVRVGVCGKTAETSVLQDALLAQVAVNSFYAMLLKSHAASNEALVSKVHAWTIEAVFSTLTNVNFDDNRIADYIHQGAILQHEMRDVVGPTNPTLAANATPIDASLESMDLRSADMVELEDFGSRSPFASLQLKKKHFYGDNEDSAGLNELAMYGLKGVCAYTAHIQELVFYNPASIPEDVKAKNSEILWSIQRLLNVVASNPTDMSKLLGTAMEIGALSFEVLGMLDHCHALVLGDPAPVNVRTTAVAGKAILVSGHDLVDLKELLIQTEGTGVNVYTHGEMLPAHAYPELHKHKHLVGNYGTAWQNQKFEFAGFPGPVIVTTNCVVTPRRNYRDRLYTINATGVSGVQHIKRTDFKQVIDHAKALKGFSSTVEPAQFHTVGFNHRAVLPLADTILDAVRDKKLSRIFVIGGCDGTQWDRNYFTDLAENTPDDTLILTLGCAKNRLIRSKKLLQSTLNREPGALPRVLDMGQCNDAYSAAVVAVALAEKIGCDVNDLPLSLAISHLEQKAVAVLLALLHLGVKSIRLGPSLPAYLTPNVLEVLSKEFNLMPTTDYKADLEAMMQGN
jgi:hydroxylamine reductase